nr:PxKF domain-containing protein [Nocardioides sp. LS1]
MDNSKKLTVGKRGTTTTAVDRSSTYSEQSVQVALSATVAATGSSVGAGTVSFQVKSGATNVGAAVTGAVSSAGVASVDYTLPAGTAVGEYTIVATYSGTGNFDGSMDNSKKLTVGKRGTTTTAVDRSSTYSEQSVQVALSATVAATGSSVGAGTVSFQVKSGATNVGAAVTGAVSSAGVASVDYTLPAGTAVGEYTIVATYSGTGNFVGSTDGSRKLTVSKRATTTVAAAVSDQTYSATATALSLSATVSAIGSSVNAGTVTFQVMKAGTVIASGTSTTVAGGAASKVLTLPAGAAVGPYTVLATYSGTSNLVGSEGSRGFSLLYGWNGFLQPVNDTAHQTGLNESKFKLGQTIPVKFDLTNLQGQVVQQTGSPTFSRSDNLGACDATASADTVPTVSPDASAVYTSTGGHYQYNWSTKAMTAGEYKVFANLADGTNQFVYICLTK